MFQKFRARRTLAEYLSHLPADQLVRISQFLATGAPVKFCGQTVTARKWRGRAQAADPFRGLEPETDDSVEVAAHAAALTAMSTPLTHAQLRAIVRKALRKAAERKL